MAFYLSHITAADFWRLCYRSSRAPGVAPPSVPFESGPRYASELIESVPANVLEVLSVFANERTHLLVPDDRSRCRAGNVKSHIWGSPLPEGSFYRYSDNLFIASPAFCFLLLAPLLPLPVLVAYGHELCGRYSFDPRADRGFRMREEPLSTVDQIGGILARAGGMPGVAKARRALRHIRAGAESPMETTTMELLALPCRYGGYGIPDLQLNRSIPLDATAQRIAGRKSCRADICHVAAKIDLEFQGKIDHEGSDALDSDRRRTNALISMGFEVIELTFGQVYDFDAFESLARLIARRTGKRIERSAFGLTPARSDLRRALFEWNRTSGHAPCRGR